VSDDPTTSHPSFQPVPPTSEALPSADPIAPAPVVPPPAAAAPTLEPVRPVPPPRKRSSSGRWLNVLLGVAAAVAIGGVAFAVGRSTAPAEAAAVQRFPGAANGNGFVFNGGSFDPNAAPGANGGNGGTGPNGGPGRFGLGGGVTIEGTVDSVTADSITITTASGQQITLALSGDTTYHTQAPASASDVTAGSKVAVQVEVTGGFRGNGNGNGNGNNGNGNGGTNGNGGGTNGAPAIRGTVSSVTVIPQ
jgi:hypothetical protein